MPFGDLDLAHPPLLLPPIVSLVPYVFDCRHRSRFGHHHHSALMSAEVIDDGSRRQPYSNSTYFSFRLAPLCSLPFSIDSFLQVDRKLASPLLQIGVRNLGKT